MTAAEEQGNDDGTRRSSFCATSVQFSDSLLLGEELCTLLMAKYPQAAVVADRGAKLDSGTNTNAISNNKHRKRVRFDRVQVRLYPVVLSNHPSCNEGAPIELGWEHFRETTFSVDDFDRHHKSHRADFKLSALQRNYKLLALGYSAKEIQLAQLAVMQTRRQRAMTISKVRSRWGRLTDRIQERSEGFYKARALKRERALLLEQTLRSECCQ